MSSFVEKWYDKQWRPAMAALYMLLCFLDYTIRPIVNYYYAKNFDLVYTVQAIKDLEPAVQVQALQLVKEKELIPPILNEFVHLALGGIVGVATWTRGAEKIQRINGPLGPAIPHVPTPQIPVPGSRTQNRSTNVPAADNPDEE